MSNVAYAKISQMLVAFCRWPARKELNHEFLRDLKPHPTSPDIFQSERSFLPDQFSFVPRLMAAGRNDIHGLSSCEKDKNGQLDAEALTDPQLPFKVDS